jgi:mono/diheme cytochrome c family protein
MMLMKSVLACAILMVPFASAQNAKKSGAASGNAASGKSVFEGQCSDCHESSSTDTKVGPGLKGVKSGKLPSGKAASHAAILNLLNTGTDVMPSFKDTLTDKQKEDVIAYVMSL